MTQGMMIARQRSNMVKPTRNRIEKRDAISTMPNDTLQNILSRLTLKEAVRTCVLSTKWRTQWASFSAVLNFDYSVRSFVLKGYVLQRKKFGLAKRCRMFVSEWETFMSGIEHTLNTLRSPSIEGLRICMDLGNPDKLAEWLMFAERKKLKMLDLDFKYNLPVPFSSASYRIRNQILPNRFKLESLHVLRLGTVDVSGEVIEGFLASCTELETLCVKESKTLKRLKVSGLGLKLKHLELVDCLYLLSLYISAENLETFRFVGECDNIRFESVPSLVEASFAGKYCNFLQLNMENTEIGGLLSQVDVLKLKLQDYYLGELDGLPMFNNVKQLELHIPHEYGAKLDRPVSLIGAFPSISVLKIKFQRIQFYQEVVHEWRAFMEFKLPNLTELEISGYRRDPSEIELLVSIFKRAPNLKRVVVDPLSPFYTERTEEVKDWVRTIKRTTTQWYIQGLKPKVPSSVELIVL